MAKRTDLKKIMIIGSGPIVIGQAAEFDYAGTQACIALKEEGYEVVLVNSNPATIMTDVSLADKVYMEPLTLEYAARIVEIERPDAIIPGIGGQTGLNLSMRLEKEGVLKKNGTRLLGTSSFSVEQAEDREKFKALCKRVGEPVAPSRAVYSLDEALEAAEEIGYPVAVRPAYTLAGSGGGFADGPDELRRICDGALRASPIRQTLIEKSARGFKEIEFEVIRDCADRVVTICGMENLDPVGVHTGDSIVAAPILSLSDRELKTLNDGAVKIIRELKIEGGCNVQFALDPDSGDYFVIEVNPRVSRSSALASKASGYPIARVSAKIAVGMTLEDIRVANAAASFEPRLDYVVVKTPRFPFDKFADAGNKLGTQMKATGEAMGVGATLSEALMKAARSLEIGAEPFYMEKFDGMSKDELIAYVGEFRYDNVYAVAQLLRLGATVSELHEITKITGIFLECLENIVKMEAVLVKNPNDARALTEAKALGFSDSRIARLWGTTELEVWQKRLDCKIFPAFRMVDSSRAGAYIPYFYSTYGGGENQSVVTDRKKAVVLGAGPIRVGQGIEFDYSTVHAVSTIKRAGLEAVIINNNPETVSTDYETADKLYFEPLTTEDVMNVLLYENAFDVVASLGGQTAVNLASPLKERGANIIGTGVEAIENAEDRDRFARILNELDIPQSSGRAVVDVESGVRAAAEVGYPVLVRPSFVLGGRAMNIVGDEERLRVYLKNAVEIGVDKPVLVDHYIMGKEVEVDAVCDGRDAFAPGIMELIERAGVHSGDSISVYPTFSLSDKVKDTILSYTKKLGLGLGVVGLYNIQFVVDKNDKVFVLEVNPRSSRTVPFLSKATGFDLADVATNVILGKSLKEQGVLNVYPAGEKRWFVKAPVFSFAKISGLDAYLSPEMKSTGEAVGYDYAFHRALYKALRASGMKLQNHGSVLVAVADKDKEEVLPLVRRFRKMGFDVEATEGTARFLKERGVRALPIKKLSEDKDEIPDALRRGRIAYVVNTREADAGENKIRDGYMIRRLSVENDVPLFTSLDTARAVLDALDAPKEATPTVSVVGGANPRRPSARKKII